jgi:chorismate dehydratase
VSSTADREGDVDGDGDGDRTVAGSESDGGRIRLGHISYSNCFPVHARLLDAPRHGDPLLVEGVPSTLNGLLARGEIDLAPSSSIEYARHPDRYRVLPDLVIGSRGPVRSILLLSNRDPRDLGSRTVAIPTASATSVVLLKILLQARWGAAARFHWFDQTTEDPFAGGADAALFIGDVALRPDLHPHLPVHLDLGAEWTAETGLPFAFAIWQCSAGTPEALRHVHRLLLNSREYGVAHREHLANRYATHFRMSAPALRGYWSDLAYDLDSAMLDGLRTFYRLAAEIGEIRSAPPLHWID